MGSKYLNLALLLSGTFSIVGNAHSAPYQFQLSGTYGQSESEEEITFFVENPTVITTESDVITIAFTYYLRPVDATTGPLAERAFLSKSAWLSGSYVIAETDAFEFEGMEFDSEEDETTIVNTRFVTQTDYIVELDYLNTDGFDGITSYSIGAGRYLDNKASAILKINHSDNDLNVLSLIYKSLEQSGASGTSFAFTGGLGYIDTDDPSGYQIIANGSYYFTDRFSVGAGLLLQKIGEGDSNTYTLNSEYFLTESIIGGIGYSRSELGDFIKTSAFSVNIGARF